MKWRGAKDLHNTEQWTTRKDLDPLCNPRIVAIHYNEKPTNPHQLSETLLRFWLFQAFGVCPADLSGVFKGGVYQLAPSECVF